MVGILDRHAPIDPNALMAALMEAALFNIEANRHEFSAQNTQHKRPAPGGTVEPQAQPAPRRPSR